MTLKKLGQTIIIKFDKICSLHTNCCMLGKWNESAKTHNYENMNKVLKFFLAEDLPLWGRPWIMSDFWGEGGFEKTWHFLTRGGGGLPKIWRQIIVILYVEILPRKLFWVVFSQMKLVKYYSLCLGFRLYIEQFKRALKWAPTWYD